MRVALIDLGTNSVRFDIHQIGPRNRSKNLHREKLMVRLGQGVFLEGKLSKDSIARTLEAFQSFRATAEELRCTKIFAYGTSALREAQDSEQFLSLIREQTGIDVRVISGEEEARLIAQGVLARESRLPRKGRFALIDIGGGSTEISICSGTTVHHSTSFPLGTARLQQVFLRHSPPRPTPEQKDPIHSLRRHIRTVILPRILSEDWGQAPWIAGSSGTIRTLSKILRLRVGGKKPIPRKELSHLISQMEKMSTGELLAIPGMDAKRVDMILGGAILFEECLLALRAKVFLPTEHSLREGLLDEATQLVRLQTDSQIELHLEEFETKVKRLGGPIEHARQVQGLCNALFSHLKRLHGLPEKWRPYLRAAAILHDIGESVSPSEHEKHSHYIVKNAHFSSLEQWEADFLARLCLHHRTSKVSAKDLAGLKKDHRAPFLRLLALLRLGDALDRGHKSHAQIRAVSIRQKEVILTLSTRESVELELLRVGQKKELFEEIFKRSIRIERRKKARPRTLSKP